MNFQIQSIVFLRFGFCLLVIGFFSESSAQSVARKWNEQNLGAIRLDIPHPPVHARNLFHVSVAMWDAWAAYDDVAVGYVHNENATIVDADNNNIDEEDLHKFREEAISYAAFRVLKSRYQNSVGNEITLKSLSNQMELLGYDESEDSLDGSHPSAVGNRVANSILSFFWDDGSRESDGYKDDTYSPENDALPLDEPRFTLLTTFNPNHWQPLAFGDFALTQNGIETDLIQKYQGSQWHLVRPFSLKRKGLGLLYDDPGSPPMLGAIGDEKFKDNINQVLKYSSWLDPSDNKLMNISPGNYGNNSLGRMDGTGHQINPIIGEPYPDNIVLRADYGRVVAEYWADGPDSETPPGHWNVLANKVSDDSRLVKKVEGSGPELSELEWDVKCYFALNAAQHDAATAAWTCKRIYDYGRPITMCRYMGSKGQSSEKGIPGSFEEISYDPEGLKLEDGLVEIITPESSSPGERHEHLASDVGSIAVYTWQGEPVEPESEVGGVGWILAMDWLPYQQDTFVTPAFASYVSGHSCFSRAGAEVLTKITGSPYFPGGLFQHEAPKGSLEFEYGPSKDLTLEWATYYDASDEAGLSRLWGGIHVTVDDLPGRVMGSKAGIAAYQLAKKYWDGSILKEPVPILVDVKKDPLALSISWERSIGLFYKVQSTIDFITWRDETEWVRAKDIRGRFEDNQPSVERSFYRVMRSMNSNR